MAHKKDSCPSKMKKKTIIAQLISEQAAVEFEETGSHWVNTPLRALRDTVNKRAVRILL